MTRGFRTTILGAAAASVTLTVVLGLSWAPLLEAFYCRRVRSDTESQRLDAIEGLVRLDRPGSITCLLDCFRSDPSETVRKAALHGLECVRLGEHQDEVFEAVRMSLSQAVERASSVPVASAAEVIIAVTRPGAAFRVKIEFDSETPWQNVAAVTDACDALELSHVVLENNAASGNTLR